MYNIAAMNKGASVAKLYSYTVPLKSDLLNTYCVLQKGFTDQFVYYRKDRPQRYLGLGRCIAIASREDLDHVLQGEVALPTVMFSFNRFDASNPKPADEMMQAFPRLRLTGEQPWSRVQGKSRAFSSPCERRADARTTFDSVFSGAR